MWFLGVSCVALAVLVVLLARQNRSLASRLDRELSRAAGAGGGGGAGADTAGTARAGTLAVGDHLEPIATFAPPPARGPAPAPGPAPGPPHPTGAADRGGESGDDGTLRFTGAPAATLLFIFGGGCEACAAMDPVVARLAAAGEAVGIGVVGVQADASGPGDLAPHVGCGYPVRGVAQKRGTWLARIVTVPGLALVDRYGTVRGAWWGVADEGREAEVRRAMETLARGPDGRR